MKYYIQRQLNEYGPYTLADLQRYVAQGSILLTDLTRSEGMTEWVPVSQVIGNIPIPVPAPAPQPPAAQPYGSGTVYGAAPVPAYGGTGTVYSGTPATQGAVAGPMPPDFHWALVLLIGAFCGIFSLVWLFIEAGFVKKIDPRSKCIGLLVGALAGPIGGYIFLVAVVAASPDRNNPPVGAVVIFFLLALTGIVLNIMAVFQMKDSLENYYNTVEPINLRLSGVMTFFFALYYFQYHFSRIAAWKKTGYLQPQ